MAHHYENLTVRPLSTDTAPRTLTFSHLKILFTIADLAAESGGPSRSVPALATALARHGATPELIALTYNRPGDTQLTPPPDLVRTTFVSCRGAGQPFKWSAQFRGALAECCARFQPHLVHDTGLWLPTNLSAARISTKSRLPRVVSPRGMLTAWALRHRGWKKRLAWVLYQKRDLAAAAALHATSPEEAQDCRRVGFRGPIAVVPNGIDLPDASSQPSTLTPQRSMRTALFLSRLHPIKGIPDLIEAWARLNPDGWRLVIAGGDENGYAADLRRAVCERGLETKVSFAGVVEGDAKRNLYRRADLFVLPSHSENFGIVIAEALAYGVPVITTKATPWRQLVEHRCGWWVEVGAEALTVAIRNAISLPDSERREMGERGRKLIETNYTWSQVAMQMKSVYAWMLGKGERPDCVLTV